MLDFRYHALSLAAVFIALTVGMLLGVAISGKLSEAEDSLTAQRMRLLNEALAKERTRADAADDRGKAARDLVERAYPAIVDERLEERKFAVLFLGPVDTDVRSAIERSLLDADSGSPARLVGLDVPVQPEDLGRELAADENLTSFASEEADFGALGEALGRELVAGGDTELWSALSGELVEERMGTSSLEVDGAVIVRSWEPPEADGVDEEIELRATETLIDGLLRGLGTTGFPVVGVEEAGASESAIDLYRSAGISSVDNVDTVAGRVALVLLLAGGRPGHYGVKESATDGVSPPVEPLPQAAGGG